VADNATINPLVAKYYTEQNRRDFMASAMQVAQANLTPDSLTNFNQISSRYPNLSKDVIMAMVQANMNVNTPGIAKIASLDGVQQLKNDMLNVDKIKTQVKADKNLLSSIGDALRNVIYDPFKGITRYGFAALRAPYDYATVLTRDVSSTLSGEKGAGLQLLKDITQFGGKATNLGALLSQNPFAVDAGSGFFISPQSKVGKDQAKAMAAYGKINGDSFTIGRFAAKQMAEGPDTTAYRITSGIIDASLNIALDPSTWFGAGSVTKIVGQGKKLAEVKQIAKPFAQTAAEETTLTDVKYVKEADKVLQGLGKTRTANKYLKNVKEFNEQKLARDTFLAKGMEKVLASTKDYYLNFEADAVAKQTLSNSSVAQWFATNPKTFNGELTKAIDTLSADMQNTGKFFDGFIILDEVPQKGKVSVGAHGMDEFFVTKIGDKNYKLVDLADDFVGAPAKVKQAEASRRAMLFDALDNEVSDFNNSPEIRQILDEISRTIKGETIEAGGPVGALYFSEGVETLGQIIGRVAAYKSPEAMAKFSDIVQSIWKADGFTNVRSIYGQTGGVVITNVKKGLAATQAEIAIAAAEIADPTSLGPNVAKLLESVRTKDAALAEAQKKLDDTKKIVDEGSRRVKDIRLFRDFANQDPDILKAIANNPEYKDYAKAIDLQIGVAAGGDNLLKEWYRYQAGLTDNFRGEVSGQLNKAMEFLLGRRFQEIAEVVAKETDAAKVHRLFGKKLTAELVTSLTAAKSADDVMKVFLEHLGASTTDPNIYRSLALRGEAARMSANPLARLIDPVSLLPLWFAEKVDRQFSRYFVRSKALHLSDTTALMNGVENWITSAGLQSASLLGKTATDNLIDAINRKLLAATTNQQRASIIENAMTDIVENLASRMGMDADAKKAIARIIKTNGKIKDGITTYSVGKLIDSSVPEVVNAGGELIPLPGAIHEHQLLNDIIHFPDTKEVLKTLNNYNKNAIINKAKAGKIFAEELGDVWRTAQLVFRYSYIIRNIAEMQMRQFFSGHASLISHPFQFISMVMADSSHGLRGKFATRVGRYRFDAAGNNFKNPDAEAEALEAIMEYRVFSHRGESVSNYMQNRNSEVFKTHRVATSTDPDFMEGLGYTINRWATDRFDREIALLLSTNADNAAKSKFVDDLIKDFDKPDNVLRQYIEGVYKKNEGMLRIFLRDTSLGDEGVTKANLSAENIYRFFFDETQEHSLASQIRAVAGNGPKSHLILDMIAKGETKFTSNGKDVIIKVPFAYSKGKSIQEMVGLEKDFKKTLETHFTSEDLIGSRVLVARKDVASGQAPKMITEYVDRWFEYAARKESKYNFGPEYQMAYWDFIGRYVPMLRTEELPKIYKNAVKSLAPVTVKNKPIGKKHPVLRVLETEIKARKKGKRDFGTASLTTVHQMAAREASKYTRELFYDAANQQQWANALRLVFPFAQAHANTMHVWGKLMWENRGPLQFGGPAVKFGKSYQALTQKDSNVIYDVSGMTYDENQGFLYTDNNGETRFKIPLAGNILGAMAAGSGGWDALQITSPVQSLNLAFGQGNPLIPGIGPAAQMAFVMSGKSNMFGPTYEIFRDIVTPFGEPTGVQDIVVPSWIRKTLAYRLGDTTMVQRGVKDWASYLASTGDYGDNPLANDAERTRLFHDAESLSREIGFLTALFQNISPATPTNEVLAKIKSPENKFNFMTLTMLYDAWSQISNDYPGEYDKAVYKFAETYGAKNLLAIMGKSTTAVTGTGDAWTFLNNNPTAADKYGREPGDVIPYFFPGGEASVKYYNWQRKTGARQPLTTKELANSAEELIYSMLKSQIAEQQIAYGYGDIWYTQQIAELDKRFGAKPPSTITSGTADEKISRVGLALQDPAFKESPIYSETAQFYSKFTEFQDLLNKAKVSNYADLGAKGGYATLMRNELQALAENLMMSNPAFSRMYYGVFASKLKG
jgi:hypothetical protein